MTFKELGQRLQPDWLRPPVNTVVELCQFHRWHAYQKDCQTRFGQALEVLADQEAPADFAAYWLEGLEDHEGEGDDL